MADGICFYCRANIYHIVVLLLFSSIAIAFLIVNLITIPLTTALWGCISLIILSPAPVMSVRTGKVVTVFLWLMNHTVIIINALPFVLLNNIFISVQETILLYLAFNFIIYWFMKRNTPALKFTLVSVLIFLLMVSIDKWNSSRQKKMIVYNVPMHSAVDFIEGNKYRLVSDSNLAEDKLLLNFNLTPARICFSANTGAESRNSFFREIIFTNFSIAKSQW